MSKHPMLFTDDMVRAIREGRKTQTRRPVKLPRGVSHDDVKHWGWFWNAWDRERETHHRQLGDDLVYPNYQIGDEIYVREAFQLLDTYQGYGVAYRADGEIRSLLHKYEDDEGFPVAPYGVGNKIKDLFDGPWRPSIHMPRWATRLMLNITEVRIRRVQYISEAGAKAEGVIPGEDCCNDYRCAFLRKWDELYSKRGLGVEVNPWVFVVTFQPQEVFNDHPRPGKTMDYGGNLIHADRGEV